MNFADIENTWRSPQNRPSAAETEQQKMKFIAELRRRRRGFILFITPVLAALTFVTGQLLLHLLRPDPTQDRIDLSREWGFLIMLVLPWFAAIYFVRQYRRHHAGHKQYAHSIPETLRALLDENRLSRMRVKTVAILHGVLLGLLPFVVFQLQAAGKAGDEILLPAFVGWPVIALCIGGALFYHYRQKLLPQKRKLEELLKAYE